MKISLVCLGLIKLEEEFYYKLKINSNSYPGKKLYYMSLWAEILDILASLEFPNDTAREEILKKYLPEDIAFCTDIRCSEFFSNLSLEEEKCIYKSFRYIISV